MCEGACGYFAISCVRHTYDVSDKSKVLPSMKFHGNLLAIFLSTMLMWVTRFLLPGIFTPKSKSTQ